MRIDIVIPNYNGFELIEKNLPVLIENIGKYDVGKVIISDDFSDPAEVEKLEKFVDKVNDSSKINILLIRNHKNLGFSSNVNRGVKEAEGDLIVLLNTDVAVEKDFLDAVLLDFANDDNLFGVGMMDKSVEDGKIVLRGRGKASWSRGFLVHSRGEVDSSDTFWISGGSSVMRRSLYNLLSGFDSLFNPFYWEDIDLSYRAKKSGYSLMFEKESAVTHYHSKGSIKKHYTDSRVRKIAYRNQFTFVWKNITDPALIFSHILWLPYHFVRAVITLDSSFLIGFAYAFIRLPAIIVRRNMQKKDYKKYDKELLY